MSAEVQAAIAGAGTALAIYGLQNVKAIKEQQLKNPQMYTAAKILSVAAVGYLAKKKGMRDAGAALTGVAAYMVGEYAVGQMQLKKSQSMGAIPGYARAAFPASNNTYYHLPNQMGAVGAELGAIGTELGAVHANLAGTTAHLA
jgi:hypothetical protein